MNRRQYGPKPVGNPPSFDFPFAQEGHSSNSRLHNATNQLHEMSQPGPRSTVAVRSSGFGRNLPSRTPPAAQHPSRAPPATQHASRAPPATQHPSHIQATTQQPSSTPPPTQYPPPTQRRGGGFGGRGPSFSMTQPAFKQPTSQWSTQAPDRTGSGFPSEDEDGLPFLMDDNGEEQVNSWNGRQYPHDLPTRTSFARGPTGLQQAAPEPRPSSLSRHRTGQGAGGMDMVVSFPLR